MHQWEKIIMAVQLDNIRILEGPISPMVVEPVILDGQSVRLEPLSLDHLAGLCEIGLDEELWRWIPIPIRTPDQMRAYIETALKWQADGIALPFATIYKPANRVIGSSRFGNIDKPNHRAEIGWTFVGQSWQRTMVNTEAKYLMLRHAFETLGCIRVEFKTDSLNEKSRNALARIGATQEAIFSNHMICANGRIRHSVYFSITDEEWPGVKVKLETKLAQPFTPRD
jgi:RimJ/RimL family protein N-acetyltransferase